MTLHRSLNIVGLICTHHFVILLWKYKYIHDKSHIKKPLLHGRYVVAFQGESGQLPSLSVVSLGIAVGGDSAVKGECGKKQRTATIRTYPIQ